MPTITYPRPCPYDETHGMFTGPTTLGRHYDEAHPEHKRYPSQSYKGSTNAQRGQCDACKTSMSRGSFRKHVRVVHPALVDPPPAWIVEPPRQKRTAIVVAKPELEAPAPAALLDMDDADGIVTFVLEQLAGPVGVIPVEHFAAIFLWREQTAAFLRAVTKQ